MQYLCYWASWVLPARIIRCVTNRQRFRAIGLGLLLSAFIAPGHVFGETKAVELSPLVAKSTLLSAVDQNQPISVILALPLSDPQGAAEFVRHVSKPGDPLFHQYLTPEEFVAKYGANSADYAALKQWA